ncbi:helix-turn-helix domain-containing protein [Levilinea saccharolytica]|uniref:helix-turn-helix domain-containing protein n=1 Tax=Levilinea saccharolytica TaxID=229921 RepID=UPI0009461CED|nr:helix-turn-helix domain-containing protein [Levilinea saccharolytica]
MEVRNHRTKLPHNVIIKAPGLLPMLYTPREICEELGIAESTLRDWLQIDLPHQRDNRNRIWINGEEFARWVNNQRKPRAAKKLTEDEAYCLRCNQVSKLLSPQIQPIKGNLVLIKGSCANCGAVINRGAHRDRTPELS